MLLGLLTALLVAIIDQLSKFIMIYHVLADYGAIIITPFFAFVRAWNTGVSFSMFNNWGINGVYILSALAMLIVAALLKWLKTEQSRIMQVALGMIIGGALGNVIDRIRLGAVFDFLDFSVGQYHWPAFNAADSFICIGAGLIILHSLLQGRKNKHKEKF